MKAFDNPGKSCIRRAALAAAIVLTTFLAHLHGDVTVLASEKIPLEGSLLPEMKLPVPQKEDEISYLGIKQKDTFKIPQIKAELVIIEVFSMYCPFCQKEAPAVNQLHQAISANQDLKDRVKMVGIGAGNSTFEVNTFRKHYSVPFPLLPDADYKIHNALGQPRTPFFIVVKLSPNGSHNIVYSKVGTFGDPNEFLDLLLKKAKMKQGG